MTTVPVIEPKSQPDAEVRPFPLTDLRSSIDRALAAIPEGDTVAVIAYADLNVARLAAYGKLGHGWTFIGTLEHEWKHKGLKAEATLAWSGRPSN